MNRRTALSVHVTAPLPGSSGVCLFFPSLLHVLLYSCASSRDSPGREPSSVCCMSLCCSHHLRRIGIDKRSTPPRPSSPPLFSRPRSRCVHPSLAHGRSLWRYGVFDTQARSAPAETKPAPRGGAHNNSSPGPPPTRCADNLWTSRPVLRVTVQPVLLLAFNLAWPGRAHDGYR